MIIYKTTNLVNGKQYIGRDSHNNPNYLGSGPLLKKAIKKYGKQNFKKEIIEECSSFEQMVQREEYWLNYYDVGNNPLFYNIQNCGTGVILIGKRNHFYGKNHSEETKQKLREINIGRKHTDESKLKISNATRGEKHPLYGKKMSDETKLKMRLSTLGKRHSEETKQKIRQLQRGEKSSCFKGYIVCTNGNYVGLVKTAREWSELLGINTNIIYTHLNGKKYKKGIKGNFFKRM
jgi:hypothetical protein